VGKKKTPALWNNACSKEASSTSKLHEIEVSGVNTFEKILQQRFKEPHTLSTLFFIQEAKLSHIKLSKKFSFQLPAKDRWRLVIGPFHS
jgi:hypothetical protein